MTRIRHTQLTWIVPALLTLGGGCGRAPSDVGRTSTVAFTTHDPSMHTVLPLTSRAAAAVDILKKEMAKYSSFARAQRDGYTTAITACMANPPVGSMGVHYGNTSIIDGAVSQYKPEVLLYEPGPNGQLTFVGVEFIVPFTAWTSPTPPVLFGQTFMANQTFQVWALHVWVGRDNPSGIFADWNPTVKC
ncbi:MAG: hypothetical protein ACT4P7_11765 [Gemmatimonadaceae bacterium]